eukprot:UN17186
MSFPIDVRNLIARFGIYSIATKYSLSRSRNSSSGSCRNSKQININQSKTELPDPFWKKRQFEHHEMNFR